MRYLVLVNTVKNTHQVICSDEYKNLKLGNEWIVQGIYPTYESAKSNIKLSDEEKESLINMMEATGGF